MKRLIPLLALFTALGAPAPAALADDTEFGPDIDETMEHLVATTQQWRAAMIADYYASLIAVDEVSPSTALEVEPGDSVGLPDDTSFDDVLALRSVEGWGAVCKLVMFALATDADLSQIGADSADHGYGFGSLFKDVSVDEEIINLGQLQKSSRMQSDKPAPALDDASSAAHPRHDHEPDKAPPGLDKKPDKVPPAGRRSTPVDLVRPVPSRPGDRFAVSPRTDRSAAHARLAIAWAHSLPLSVFATATTAEWAAPIGLIRSGE